MAATPPTPDHDRPDAALPEAGEQAAPASAAPQPVGTPPAAERPSRLRSGVMPFVLGAAAVIVVVVLAGGTSWVVARASASEALPAATGAAAARHSVDGARTPRAGVVRGRITELGTRSWTIATARGESVTVSIGSATRFESGGSAVDATSFHVGDTVVVTGTRSGTTLEARRIALPPSRTGASSSTGA